MTIGGRRRLAVRSWQKQVWHSHAGFLLKLLQGILSDQSPPCMKCQSYQ